MLSFCGLYIFQIKVLPGERLRIDDLLFLLLLFNLHLVSPHLFVVLVGTENKLDGFKTISKYIFFKSNVNFKVHFWTFHLVFFLHKWVLCFSSKKGRKERKNKGKIPEMKKERKEPVFLQNSVAEMEDSTGDPLRSGRLFVNNFFFDFVSVDQILTEFVVFDEIFSDVTRGRCDVWRLFRRRQSLKKD